MLLHLRWNVITQRYLLVTMQANIIFFSVPNNTLDLRRNFLRTWATCSEVVKLGFLHVAASCILRPKTSSEDWSLSVLSLHRQLQQHLVEIQIETKEKEELQRWRPWQLPTTNAGRPRWSCRRAQTPDLQLQWAAAIHSTGRVHIDICNGFRQGCRSPKWDEEVVVRCWRSEDQHQVVPVHHFWVSTPPSTWA